MPLEMDIPSALAPLTKQQVRYLEFAWYDNELVALDGHGMEQLRALIRKIQVYSREYGLTIQEQHDPVTMTTRVRVYRPHHST
jgi:hypothetical protein